MSKGTEIILDPTFPAHKEAEEALLEFVEAKTKAAELELKAGIASAIVKRFAEDRWLKLFTDRGVLPSSPFKLISPAGKSVSFVVTDKTEGYELKPEAGADLEALLGADLADDLVTDCDELFIDREIMDQSSPRGVKVGVVLCSHIPAFMDWMSVQGHLTPEQAGGAFRQRCVKRLAPGLVGKLPEVARKAKVRITDVLGIIGSAVTRYLK